MTERASSSSGKISPDGVPAPFAVISAEGVVTYSGVGAQVSPAPPGVVPPVSRSQAIADLAAAGVGPIRVTQRPASLRLVEYENVFGTQNRTGSMTPSVPKQLAWFAVYDVPDFGPLSFPAGMPKKAYYRPRGTCELFSAISANTGRTLDAFDYCGPGS